MTRFIAQTLVDRLEREWRMIDPERQKVPSYPPIEDSKPQARRLRMGRFDEIDLAHE
jgi:hypothetical protein